MNPLRNKLSAILSAVVKISGGLASFVIQARFLGAEQFGILGITLAAAGLASLLSDFGLHHYLIVRHRTRSFLSKYKLAIIIKLGLSLVTCLASVIYVIFAIKDYSNLGAVLCLSIGFFLAAVADLVQTPWRASELYINELLHSLLHTVVFTLVVSAVSYRTQDLDLVAISFLATRFIYLVHTVFIFRRELTLDNNFWSLFVARLLRVIRQSRSFAGDSFLAHASNQIDLIIMAGLLKPVEVGIYAAGTRLIQSALPVVSILASSYLPALIRAENNSNLERLVRLRILMTVEFAFIGAVAGVSLYFLGPLAVILILGDEYSGLNGVWLGFSVFLFTRCLFLSAGVQLVASNRIRTRLWVQSAGLVLTTIFLLLLLPLYGFYAAPWTVSVITGFSALVFFYSIHRRI